MGALQRCHRFLKPTSLDADQIVVRAFSDGGTSLASDLEFETARVAAEVVSAGGLGEFSGPDLRRFLTGKTVSVSRFINEFEEGLTGQTSRRHLETLLQYIHLAFTQPRADGEALSSVLNALTFRDSNRAFGLSLSPDSILRETMDRRLTQDHPRARPAKTESIRLVDVSRALAFYKDRFADASDFTFVFVGALDLPTLQPLVEHYLGGLPALHRRERWKNVGSQPPKGVVEETILARYPDRPPGLPEGPIEGRVALAFTGPFQHDQTQRLAIRALALIVQARLREIFTGRLRTSSQ